MSSVAVLTQESFAEHRSGLVPQQIKVATLNSEEENDPPTYKDAFPPLPEKAACLESAQEPAGAWSNKIRPIKASVITQVFHVPLEERKYKDMNQFGEGEQAKICLEIMQRTGAHLELSLAKDQGLSIMVSGKLDAVMKARKDIVARLQTQASATVPIPKEHHRFVIGKNGEKLQDLELKTATKIQIPRPDDPSNQIKITGTKEGIEKARHEVLLISAEQDKRAVERLEVEKAFHPFIAGPYNRLVGEIMQETGTRINIPPPSVNRTEIVFTGEKEQLAQAVARIKKIYEEKKKKTTTIAVEVKKSQHKYVIGPKGNSLQEILERTGVSVEIPPSDSPSIQENGDEAGEGREAKETDPGSPRRCDIIIISGRKEKCEAAKEALEALVPVTIEVEVPFDLHRYIIGQKGSGIRKMMDEFEVNIHVPAPELQSDTIAITGLAANLDRAKAGLLDRVKELQAEQEDRALRSFKLSVTVDPKYHPKIIGRKGAVITQIRLEHEVNIQFPDKDDGNQPQDQITITGYEKNTEAARDAILKIVGELEQMVSEDVPLDHRVHARIIGARGKAIRKIMDEFKVDIRFPQSGAPDPNCVTVTGLPENVEVSQQSLVGWPCVAASPGLVSTQQAQGLLLMLCSGTGTPLCETLSKVIEHFVITDSSFLVHPACSQHSDLHTRAPQRLGVDFLCHDLRK